MNHQAPVIAIFTKFDDLISQIYDDNLDYKGNHAAAARILEETFQKPLFKFKNPPEAHLFLEDKFVSVFNEIHSLFIVLICRYA